MIIHSERQISEYGYRVHFEAEADSPLDLLEGVPASEARRREIDHYMSQSGHGPHGQWFDRGLPRGATTGDVVRAITSGWPSFLENLLPKIAQLKPPQHQMAQFRQTKRRRRRVRGDLGNEVDIHDVRQGRLDRAWTRTMFEQREDHSNRNVHLVINCSLLGSVRADEAEWRTAAAVAVYDELVRMGKSVAIYMMRNSTAVFRGQVYGRDMCSFMVPVKRLGTQMSQYHVAAYCSASFTRAVMMYRYANLIPGREPGSSYGAAQNLPMLTRSLRRARDAGQSVLYLPHALTLHEARAAVDGVVAQAQGRGRAA